MTRNSEASVRTLAAGIPALKTENGWNDVRPIEDLLKRIVEIATYPERHAHADALSLETCCSRDGRSSPFLVAAHGRYVGASELDPRYADGRPPGAPALPVETDSFIDRWRRQALEHVMDIARHPGAHDHYGMGELNDCCSIDGRFDWALLVAHGLYATLGHNPVESCDAFEGPCACGAWHKWGEPR